MPGEIAGDCFQLDRNLSTDKLEALGNKLQQAKLVSDGLAEWTAGACMLEHLKQHNNFRIYRITLHLLDLCKPPLTEDDGLQVKVTFSTMSAFKEEHFLVNHNNARRPPGGGGRNSLSQNHLRPNQQRLHEGLHHTLPARHWRSPQGSPRCREPSLSRDQKYWRRCSLHASKQHQLGFTLVIVKGNQESSLEHVNCLDPGPRKRGKITFLSFRFSYTAVFP